MVFGHALLPAWPLDPSITYLNHGTVGVAPRRVLQTQQALRDEMERQPSAFMLRRVSRSAGTPEPGPTLIREAAGVVARFVGARGQDLVFVDNATSGVNAVIRSLPLQAGDEILLTDHTYGAVANAARFIAGRRGAVVRSVDVPFPRFDAAQLTDRIDAAIGPHTKLLVIDHITSASAIVMPVADLAAACHARGVAVLVDGAHAPGAIPLDVPALGVDWYVANLHKWAMAPRSSAFLWAAADRQAELHPLVISWNLGQGFTAEFDMVGTRDPTPWLAAPAGIEFLRDLGLDAVYAWNHQLACDAARLLESRWGTTVGVADANLGTMVTVPAPDRLGRTVDDAHALRDALLGTHRIEVHVFGRFDRVWVRASAQVYNDLSDIERLADAVLAA
jgi:isopenicillin-N epimerase